MISSYFFATYPIERHPKGLKVSLQFFTTLIKWDFSHFFFTRVN